MEISYYLLPRNPELKKKWFQAINRLDWNSEKSSIICSRHFDNKDLKSYKNCKSRVCFREGALPKITKKSQEVVKPMNNELGRPSTRCPISPKKKKKEDDNSMENNMHPNVKIIGNDYHIQWEPKSQKKVEPLNNEMGRSSTQCPIRQKKKKENEITITENNVHANVKIVGDYYHIECNPKSSNDSMKIDKELRKYSMDRRRLQVKLTRLPMHLFKNGKMTTKLSVTDIEELEALGLHTEINIKLDPEERLKEEPPDFTTDYDNVVDHDTVCSSVLNIKLETEEELIKTEEKLNKTEEMLHETEELNKTENKLDQTEKLNKTEYKLDETEKLNKTEYKLDETEELNKTENKLDQTEKLNKTEYKLDETEKLNKTEYKLDETEKLNKTENKLDETEEMWNETVDKLNKTEDKLNETEEELSETEAMLNETENLKEQPLGYSGSDDDVDDDDGMFYNFAFFYRL
ncbi:hypothetical protein O0L34_g4022 [Tuta absoluta]|nr:hypothetical protein O0L34_g4022 [Tuta absoluta]